MKRRIRLNILKGETTHYDRRVCVVYHLQVTLRNAAHLHVPASEQANPIVASVSPRIPSDNPKWSSIYKAPVSATYDVDTTIESGVEYFQLFLVGDGLIRG